MLRLVRDDEVEFDDSLDMDLDDLDEMPEQQLQAEGDEKVGAEAPAPPAEGSDEARDGAVDTSGENETSENGGLAPINLGVLEALLLSTHHPLTAGRLAELLDLPSTKPIRKAVKELNSQYES